MKMMLFFRTQFIRNKRNKKQKKILQLASS